MSNVGCTGTESRVLDCSYYPFHECTHSNDVGIKCEGKCYCTHLNNCMIFYI